MKATKKSKMSRKGDYINVITMQNGIPIDNKLFNSEACQIR